MHEGLVELSLLLEDGGEVGVRGRELGKDLESLMPSWVSSKSNTL